MTVWQPIETAPKDGSFILMATPKGRIADGFWSPVYGVWSWPYVMVEPTHWRPLPELPGAQPAPSIPEGWKLVPIELTDEMVRVATAEYVQACSRRLHPNIAWRRAFQALLSAAQEAKP